MYICVIKNMVKEGYEDSYLETSKKFAADMQTVNGCHKTWVLQDTNQKNVIVNVELWESEAHKKADDGKVFLTYKADLKKGFLTNTTETYYTA